jgi:hypothetical protein
MVAPTLQDLMGAIVKLTSDVGHVRSEMATGFTGLRSEMATGFDDDRSEMATGFADVRSDIARVESKVDALDRDLDAHMALHREVETDIAKLKKDVTGLKARRAAKNTRAPRRR